MTALSGLRVLIVEDDPDTAELYARFLSLEGADTKICTDPLDCVSHVESFLPHAVLLDIRLRHVSGIELAGRIRSNPKIKPVPFLIASTGLHTKEVLDAVGATFDHYLLKPYTLEALLAVLRPLHQTISTPRDP